MADPGWYKDRVDPALARWFDGEEWTEHTLVRADQPPGVLPPPPAGWRPREPEPEPWVPPVWSPPTYVPPPKATAAESVGAESGGADRARPEPSLSEPVSPEPALPRSVPPASVETESFASEPTLPTGDEPTGVGTLAASVPTTPEQVGTRSSAPVPHDEVGSGPASADAADAADVATDSSASAPGADAGTEAGSRGSDGRVPAAGEPGPAGGPTAAIEPGPGEAGPPVMTTSTNPIATVEAPTDVTGTGESAAPSTASPWSTPSRPAGPEAGVGADTFEDPRLVIDLGISELRAVPGAETVDLSLQLDTDGAAGGGSTSSSSPRGAVPAPSAPPPEPHEAGGVAESASEPGPASHLEELAPQGPGKGATSGPSVFDEPTFIGPPTTRIAALPRWIRIAVPVVVAIAIVIVMVVLLVKGGGADARALSAADAVSVVPGRVDVGISDARVHSTAEQLCGSGASERPTPALGLAEQLLVEGRRELRSTLNAVTEERGTAAPTQRSTGAPWSTTCT